MKKIQPGLWAFIGTALSLLLTLSPTPAYAQSCMRKNSAQLPFEKAAFDEMRHAQIISPTEILFLELPGHMTAPHLRTDSYVYSHPVSMELPMPYHPTTAFTHLYPYSISRVVIEKEVLNNNCNCADCELVEFQLLLDCQQCTMENPYIIHCIGNYTPQWINVDFNPAVNPVHVSGNRKRVEMNVLNTGLAGARLCWRALFRSENRKKEHADCAPRLTYFNIDYQAAKSDEYSRSSPMPIANMAFVSSFHSPNFLFDTDIIPRPPTGYHDHSRRGMVRAYELYNPEKPEITTKTLKWSMKTGRSNPARADYGTAKGEGPWQSTEAGIFDDFYPPGHLGTCQNNPLNLMVYELDRNSQCTARDRSLLKDWMSGLDDYGYSPIPRARGAIHTAFEFSTPAIYTGTPLVPPPWVREASQLEIANYNHWKASRPNPHMALLLLGSTTGDVYAVDAGTFVPETEDGCLVGTQHHRGFFKPFPGCQKEAGSLKRQIGELTAYPGTGKVKTVYYPWKFRPNYIYEYNSQYYGTTYQSELEALRPSLNASAAFVDVDFMSPQANAPPEFENPDKPLTWTHRGPNTQGAHTLVAMGSGPTQSLFQVLRVIEGTRLSSVWELDFKTNTRVQALWNEAPSRKKPRFGLNSSRHTPLVGRFMLNRGAPPLPTGIAKWLAIVGSDFRPGLDADGNPLAGVVSLVDLYTGELLKLSPQIAGADWAGFVLLEPGEGVGGEIVALDLQEQALSKPSSTPDGLFDTLYVPTTFGRVYKINLLDYNPGGGNAQFGDAYGKCKVIDIPQLAKTTLGLSEENARRQGIYSNIAVYKKGKVVRIYVGTADNPDIFDTLISPPAERYYVLAFELDESTQNQGSCQEAKLLWHRPLPPGEKVWGGLSVNVREVVAGTAKGHAADACGLDENTTGHAYVLEAETGEVVQSHAAQMLSPPVAYDGHFLYVDAHNNFNIVASDGITSWNNSIASPPSVRPSSMQILDQTFEKDVRKEGVRQKREGPP